MFSPLLLVLSRDEHGFGFPLLNSAIKSVLINNHQLSALKVPQKKKKKKKKNIISFKENPDFYEYLVLKPEGYCLHSVFCFQLSRATAMQKAQLF